MAQGPSDTILVAIRITLRIRESKVRNPDPPDRRRFVLSECVSCSICCGCVVSLQQVVQQSHNESNQWSSSLKHLLPFRRQTSPTV